LECPDEDFCEDNNMPSINQSVLKDVIQKNKAVLTEIIE
jgi:hypothetical protein